MQQNAYSKTDPGAEPTFASKGNNSTYPPPQDKDYIDFEEVKE